MNSLAADFQTINEALAQAIARHANDNCPPTIPPPALSLVPSSDQVKLIHGCGLEMMRSMPSESVDLALCDLPYGMTRTKFDPIINVDEHMYELHRIVTHRGAVVAFSAQPFTNDLINASRAFDVKKEMFFKQEIIWEKDGTTGFSQARARHLKAHENILVFSKGVVIGGARTKRAMTYNPQGAFEVDAILPSRGGFNYLGNTQRNQGGKHFKRLTNCPRSVLRFAKEKGKHIHPFAKPVPLLEYLINTFSNAGEVVLDPTAGSGSAAVAAINTGRKFIGAEIDRAFHDIAEKRIMEARMT